MSYNIQVSPDRKTLRSGALTSAFDLAPSALKTQAWNQTVYFFDVTLDTATDVRVRFDVATPATVPNQILDVEPATGSSEWFQLPYQDNGSGSTTSAVTTVPLTVFELKFTVSGRYAYPLPVNYMWTRARAKATGTVGSATLSIKASTGQA